MKIQQWANKWTKLAESWSCGYGIKPAKDLAKSWERHSNNSTCSFWLAYVFLCNLHAFPQHISERVSVESVINKWKNSCHFAWRNGSIAGCLFILQITQWHWTWKAFLSIKNYFYQHQNSTIIINGESKTY